MKMLYLNAALCYISILSYTKQYGDIVLQLF